MTSILPRNVLLIHTDQQRSDSLGCTGNRFAVTPNLDALAKDACLYRRHIASNPICMPSRASLFTGRFPTGHGVYINGTPLPRLRRDPGRTGPLSEDESVYSNIPTLADVFGQSDYQTASIGKLHFTPTRSSIHSGCIESTELWEQRDLSEWHGPYYGFDHVEMSLTHGEGTAGHYLHWRDKHFPEVSQALKKERQLPFPQIGHLHRSAIPVEAHHTTWAGQQAAEFLRRRDTGKPFFLFLGFADPHHPFTPPAELAREFETHDAMPAHWDRRELEDKPSAMRQLMTAGCPWSIYRNNLTPEAIHLCRQYTDAMNHLIDREVGRVLQTLKDSGQWEDTIVIFTSDHGDYLGDHGMITKSIQCSDCLVHVPLLIRDPAGRLPREDARATSNTDVLPTLCEMLSVPQPKFVQGRSLLDSTEPRTALVTSFMDTDRKGDNFSIYDARFRLTLYPATGERELYDHATDPHELTNRTGDRALADDESRLYLKLLEEVTRTNMPSAARLCMW